MITLPLSKMCSKNKSTHCGWRGSGRRDKDSLTAFTTLQRAIIYLKGPLEIHREFSKPKKIHMKPVILINDLLCF